MLAAVLSLVFFVGVRERVVLLAKSLVVFRLSCKIPCCSYVFLVKSLLRFCLRDKILVSFGVFLVGVLGVSCGVLVGTLARIRSHISIFCGNRNRPEPSALG